MSGWGPKVFPGSGGGQIPGDTSAPDTGFFLYDEANLVAPGVLTDILVWTVPTTPIHHIIRVEFGGTNIARYWLKFGSITKNQSVTWFNGNITGYWDYQGIAGGLFVPAGTVVKVQVEHGRPFSGDFFAHLHAIQIN